MSFYFELHQSKMSLSNVIDPSTPASGQGLGFLAGLGLTVRHRPYLNLVISFLFISAAVQVCLARLIPTGWALAILSLHRFRLISRLHHTTGKPVAGKGLARLMLGGEKPTRSSGTGESQGPDTRKCQEG